MKIFIYFATIIYLVIIGFIDFKHKLIPNKFVLAVGCLGIINILFDIKNFKVYILSALIVFLFFFILAILSNGGIGGGDIKLFTVLSLIFGQDIYYIILFTYVIAFIVSIIMLLLKKSNLKTSVALAPFITLGTLTYLFF